jgi:hypothetical protein
LNDIEELRKVIRYLHDADAEHVESVPVKETFQGATVWDGVVEVFRLMGHPKAKFAYAWAHETGNPESPKRHIAVLHIPPIISPETAVRTAIIKDQRESN